MVITVSCDVLGEKNNGTTIAAYNLIESLKKKGHEVRVLCSDPDKKGREGYYIVKRLSLGPLNGYLKKNGVALSRPDKKTVRAALDGVDAVHVMTPFFLGSRTLKEAKRRGIPVTAGFHCQAENFTSHIFMKNCALANRIVYKRFYNNFYCKADAVHYPTQFIHDVFEKYGGKTNGYVISNGVGKEFCPGVCERPDDGEIRILFTGRYSREKSHDVLIDAVKRSKYKDSIRLIFAGDGPLKKKLQKKGSRLPLSPVFKFYGREELIGVIRSADLYVHPAEIEIEAISCLEAIACGAVPVISDSRRSATRYFAIDGMNLFRCNDSADLASRIDWWIEHPKEKEQRSLLYRGYAEQFDFDRCMDRMEQMIIETAETKVCVLTEEQADAV